MSCTHDLHIKYNSSPQKTCVVFSKVWKQRRTGAIFPKTMHGTTVMQRKLEVTKSRIRFPIDAPLVLEHQEWHGSAPGIQGLSEERSAIKPLKRNFAHIRTMVMPQNLESRKRHKARITKSDDVPEQRAFPKLQNFCELLSSLNIKKLLWCPSENTWDSILIKKF